jgi:hypothetical protein
MKKITVFVAVVALAAGCTSTGAVDPNLAQRLNADSTCLFALAQQGVGLSASKVTAQQVLDTVQANSSNPAVAQACATLVGNILSDAAAGKIKLQSKTAPKPVAN